MTVQCTCTPLHPEVTSGVGVTPLLLSVLTVPCKYMYQGQFQNVRNHIS